MGHKRSFDPKAFATGTERCPVELWVIKSFFHGATLNNCTLNIKINNPIKMQSKPPKKRRRVLLIDDEGDDEGDSE